jgi:radical SAM superfamily enzyme YgiQ (UPF0313 family)
MKTMKILLVICPFFSEQRVPNGLAYLKSSIKNKSINVKCRDLNIEFFHKMKPLGENFDENAIKVETNKIFSKVEKSVLDKIVNEWSDQIVKFNPRVLGFSLYESTKEFSLLLAKKIKEKNNNIIIVFGGPDCIINKNLYINKNFVDMIVLGEGEETFKDLINKIYYKKRLNSVKGIIFKEKNKVITNKERTPIKNLDLLSFPDYSDFDLSLYKHPIHKKVYLPIITSRGCINKCKFCNHYYFWKTFRLRSAENVIKEIKYLIQRYAVHDFIFNDSIINASLERLSKLCDLIVKNKLNIRWSANTTFSKKMNKKLFDKIKKAGCRILVFGLESGSQSVIDDMGKNFELKDAERILKDCHESGIKTHILLLIGYPSETENDFLKTVEFIKKNRESIDSVTIGHGCVIAFGSYLHSHKKEYGIEIINSSWSNNLVPPQTRLRRLREIKKIVDELNLKYDYYSEKYYKKLNL